MKFYFLLHKTTIHIFEYLIKKLFCRSSITVIESRKYIVPIKRKYADENQKVKDSKRIELCY